MSEDYGQNSVAIPVDDILGDGFPIVSQQITLAIASAATLARGTVLGLLTKSAPVLAKVSGTGVATFGAVTLLKPAEVGTYTITCTAAVNGGTPAQFSVRSPSGFALPTLAAATAYASSHFTLTDAGVPAGTTAWAIGDIISLTVTGSGQAKAYSAAAVDGSGVAALILSHDIAVGAAAVPAVAYRTGVFRRAKLTGLDAAAVAQLDARNIFVR